jgi:hypothetical protein
MVREQIGTAAYRDRESERVRDGERRSARHGEIMLV